MENFYLSPMPSLIIMLCLLLMLIVMYAYYMFSKSIISSYTFKIHTNIQSIVAILQNSDKYNIWWAKLNKLWIYEVDSELFYNNSKNARITITIKSNKAKENWDIIINQLSSKLSSVTLYKKTSLLSKLERICNSTCLYKRDLILFEKSLKKVLITRV